MRRYRVLCQLAAYTIGMVAAGQAVETTYPSLITLAPGGAYNSVLQLTNQSGVATRLMWKRLYTGGTRDVGSIYSQNNGDNFTVQNMTNDGALFLRNFQLGTIKLVQQQPWTIGTGATAYTHSQAMGFVAIGRNDYFNNINTPNPHVNEAPWARLHLVDDAVTVAEATRCRDWMRNGVMFTGNADQMYIGQKNALSGRTDAVVQWSGTAGGANSDRMRFIFTQPAVDGSTGATGPEGLEAMRFFPVSSSEAYVGIGDFFTISPDDPTERLDIRSGHLRIRGLSTDLEDLVATKVLMADNTGVVHWRDLGNFNSTDCKWTMNAASPNHVYTAAATTADPACPDVAEAVGIGVDLGTNTPQGKLDLRTSQFATGLSLQNSTSSGTTRGLHVTTSGGSPSTRGIEITTTQSPGCAENKGIQITAQSSGSLCGWGNINYGLRADVTGNSWWTRGVSASCNGGAGGWTEYGGEFLSYGNPAYPTGVYGLVNAGIYSSTGVQGETASNAIENWGTSGSSNATLSTAGANYTGVYGTATVLDATAQHGYAVRGYMLPGTDLESDANGRSSWAGYFEGETHSPSGFWTDSDLKLKENVEELAGEQALGLIGRLSSKTYTFNVGKYGFMGLPTGLQLGVIAQEVEEVLPELVTRIVRPADLDSAGGIVHEAVEFRAVQYQGFIPVLLAGVKEQQAILQDKQSQIDALNERLAALEKRLSGGSSVGGTGTTKAARLEQNAPNPFNENTVIRFYVPEGSKKATIKVVNVEGKEWRTFEGLSSGDGQLVIAAGSMPAGSYSYSLTIDGEKLDAKTMVITR